MATLNYIQELDIKLLVGIQNALNADWLTPLMKGVSFLGDKGWFWILLCLALILFKRTRRLGIICGISLGLAFLLCNGILKPLVDRTRPWVVSSAVNALIPPPGDASFPSGHANASMAAAWAFWINTGVKSTLVDTESLRRKLHTVAGCMLVLTAAICLSRLYLGVHFPTDVLAGILVGAGSAAIVRKAYVIMQRRQSQRLRENMERDARG